MRELGKLFARIRGMPWLLAVAAVGLLLLLIPIGDTDGQEKASLSYSEMLEHRIAQMTETLPGVDDVSVMVTLEQDRGRGVSVYGGDAEENRRISGIAVSCIGGGDARIRLEILHMLCAVFDLSADRVWIGGKDSPYIP